MTYRVTARPAPRPTPLSARGALVAVFGASVAGCLIASWANWDAFAGWVFFMASGLAAYYVRPGMVLPVMVSPPAIFGAAIVLAKVVTAPGLLSALSSAVVTLAGVAGWMFTGMALTIAIGLGRGVTAEVRDLVLASRLSGQEFRQRLSDRCRIVSDLLKAAPRSPSRERNVSAISNPRG